MYIALFLFLIFYDALEAYVPMGNYWDELTTFLVLCWGAYDFWKHPKMEKGEILNWICLILLVLIGAVSNVLHPGLQEHTMACVKDVVALCKFPAMFLLLQRRKTSAETLERNLAMAAKLSRWILVVTLVGVALGRFVDLGFYTGEVRTVPTFQFVFSHPTFYISSYVLLAAVLMAESVRKNRVYLLLDCLLIFMAQRTKGNIFIVFVVLFLLLGEQRVAKLLKAVFGSDTERLKLGKLLLAAAAMVLAILVVGKSKIEATYRLGMTFARTALYVVGIKIMVDYFPLGSGFGTFASYLSGRHYSNIYELYEISNLNGMTRDKYNFVSDVFWPYIYGQFGIFGLLIYLKLIFSIFLRQFQSRISDGARLAVAAVWIYALIATTAEAYFTNGTGVQMALFLSLFIGYGGKAPKKEALPE